MLSPDFLFPSNFLNVNSDLSSLPFYIVGVTLRSWSGGFTVIVIPYTIVFCVFISDE